MTTTNETLASIRGAMAVLRASAESPDFNPTRFEILMCLGVIDMLVALVEVLVTGEDAEG